MPSLEMAPTVMPRSEEAWRRDLPDEQASELFAREMAQWVEPGDLVALWGGLGAGKTFLARALLRHLTGNPNLEAPSPTFTLMQSYDGPGYPILHADFYRLSGSGDLENLGWDEARDGALTLLEWPDRAGARLPGNRLDIELSFAPDLGASGRRALVTAHGALATRLAIARAIANLIDKAGWSSARRDYMQGDASIRAYERLTRENGQTAILMIAPPRKDGPLLRYGKPYAQVAKLSPDIRAFIAVAEGLRAQGYSTPQIIAADVAQGLALLEDFGAETVADDDGAIDERYLAATSLLADLHRRDLPPQLPAGEETYQLPSYDQEALIVEVELMLDWYAPHVANVSLGSGARASFLGHWRQILTPVLQRARSWTLRDFHSPNLHWMNERTGLRRIGIIDFQDAVMGPPAYDVASLLQDARVDVSDELELHLLSHYVQQRAQSDTGFDAASFAQAYAIMGAQRTTKILGIFARLDKRDGKPQYLANLPRVARYLNKNLAHPSLAPLKQWFAVNLPVVLRG